MSPLKPIAIVGIHAELPSGAYSKENLDYVNFFKFLLDAGEAYEPIPLERFNLNAWRGRGLGKVLPELGVFLKDTSMFDNLEFGITSRDARAMAVSTRKLVESSFLALLDSGINYRGRNVGCYTSGIAFDINSLSDPDEFEARGSFAGIPSMVANRVSYHLDLLGPSIPTDTACSSTLTALHLAVQAIRNEDCEAAVVAGCQLNHRLIDFIQYSQGSLVSVDGKCKPFDESANGFSRGEGAVAIVIKLLEDALRDGDHIYASILGTGINNGGGAAPVGAPVPAGQIDAMHRAFRGIGRMPSEVDYIELHATGTAAGDPAEANWVGEEFKRDGEILVGSVKGNIGHLEITAFLASLCKVCGMFEQGLIPPAVNLKRLNPSIKWDEFHLKVPQIATALTSRSSSRASLVSILSSGIGGSNGHCVVEGPPSSLTTFANPMDPSKPVLLVAAGLSPRSATVVAENLNDLVCKQTSLSQLSTLYGRRSRQMTWRSFQVFSPGQATPIRFPPPTLVPRTKPPIAFVFSGQGPQHITMGRQLYQIYSEFRESVLRMDRLYQNIVGSSLIEATGIFQSAEDVRGMPEIWPITITLPAIAMVQIALVDLFSSVGILPDIVIGHSAGETAMMYASGFCSWEMALEIAIARGQAMSIAEKVCGTMAALACAPSDAMSLIRTTVGEDASGRLELACYNSTTAVTVAGLEEDIDKLVELAQKQGTFARKLRTRTPVHSSLMDICSDEYKQRLGNIFDRHPRTLSQAPKTKVYSTLTGELWSTGFTADYFWKNTRMPVMFTHAMSKLLRDFPSATFIELSPHPVLSSYISSLGALPDSVLCPMRRDKDGHPNHEISVFLDCLGRLAVIGYNCINFSALNRTEFFSCRSQTPPYPFARRHIPYYPPSSTMAARQLGIRQGPLNRGNLKVNALTHPALSQHVITGEAIMPAAGYLEMAFEYGARILWDVRFRSMMPLSSEKFLYVDFDLDGSFWTVKSRLDNVSRGLTATERLHAEGYMSLMAPNEQPACTDIPALKNRLEHIDTSDFYESLRYFAQYGPLFQRTTSFYKGRNEALVHVRGLDSDVFQFDFDTYVVNPVILDACFHALVSPAFTANADQNVYYLPDRIGMVQLHDIRLGTTASLYVHVVLCEWNPDDLVYNVAVMDELGNPLCTMADFHVARHELSIVQASALSISYDLEYQPFDLPSIDIQRVIQDQTVHDQLKYCDEETPDSTPQPSAPEKGLAPWLKFDKEILVAFISAIHRALEIMVKSQKRVLRVMAICDDTLWLSKLFGSFLKRHSGVHIHCIGCNPPAQSTSLTCHPFSYDIDLTPEQQRLGGHTFDIIILCRELDRDGRTQPLLSALHDLLIPGGMLFLRVMPMPQEWDCVNETLYWKHKLESTGFADIASPTHPSQFWGLLSLKAAAIPLDITPGPTNLLHTTPTILTFRLGQELGLRYQLSKMDTGSLVWIEATLGLDGAASRGFFRSLRREMARLELRLALFDSTWDAKHRASAIFTLSQKVLQMHETEFSISSDGRLFVPRLIPHLSMQSARDTFDFNDHWILSYNGIVRPPLPKVPPAYTLLKVTNMSIPLECSFRIVTGIVVNSQANNWRSSENVVALAEEILSSHSLVHETRIVRCPEDLMDRLPQLIPAILVLAHTIGIQTLTSKARLENYRILVIEDSSIFSQSLKLILENMGCRPSHVHAHASLSSIRCSITGNDIVLTGASAKEQRQLVSSSLSPNGTAIFWNDVMAEFPALLAKDRWWFSDIVCRVIPLLPSDFAFSIPPAWSPSAHVQGSSVSITFGREAFFDPRKVYLLLGGIGSLGIRLALWMYKKGARKLILTSRSGRASLHNSRDTDTLLLRILAYLENQKELDISLLGCDASYVQDMLSLLKGITSPIGGCILLSAVLSDRLFQSHDEGSYRAAFPPKFGAFNVLKEVLPIQELDFLITLSSAATFGNAGQTNYSSANTLLDELTRPYPNAFSLVAPAILDTSMVMAGTSLKPDPRLSHLTPWAISSQELFSYIEDGILKLAEGPFWLYVPALDWDKVQKYMGNSLLYDHLVQPSVETIVSTPDQPSVVLKDLVLEFLDVSADDFLPEVPFTSYGLDSLSAGRLSFALRPIIHTTQLQLLGDMSLDDLEGRVNKQAVDTLEREPTRDAISSVSKRFNWDRLNQSGETVVTLVDGEGVPLILIHGFSGNIVAFMHLQEVFISPLWAIQTTPETPLDSIANTALFYADQIQRARPAGPYRIGGFSASSLLTFQVAWVLEARGEHVIQLAMLDHFPTLFTSPIFELDDSSLASGKPSVEVMRYVIRSICECYLRDHSPVRRKIAEELQAALDGLPVREYIEHYFDVVRRMTSGVTRFLVDIATKRDTLPSPITPSRESVRVALVERLKSVRAPVTIYVAERGMRPSLPDPAPGWEDLGCTACFPNARVISLDSSHFDMFEKEKAVDSLQNDW